MALTRNEHAVHEETGRYENLRIGTAFGLVLGPEIDLRLFLQVLQNLRPAGGGIAGDQCSDLAWRTPMSSEVTTA